MPTEDDTRLAPEESKAPASADEHPPKYGHVNWVPPELRVPDDEFFDLSSIVPIRTESHAEDDSLEVLITEEGTGSVPEAGDTVYYKHSTRFSNG